MQLNVDYRGVNKEVWNIFYRIYGGGPFVVREALDVYSKDMSRELSGGKMARTFTKRSREKDDKGSNIFKKRESVSPNDPN